MKQKLTIRRNRHLAYYNFLWATGLVLFVLFLPFALMKWVGTGAIDVFDDIAHWRWNTARTIAIGKSKESV